MITALNSYIKMYFVLLYDRHPQIQSRPRRRSKLVAVVELDGGVVVIRRAIVLPVVWGDTTNLVADVRRAGRATG